MAPVLYYERPASNWLEALPIGNGRLGAMVFGGVEVERLALNEDTLWSGPPESWDNPGAARVLPKVRELVFQERYAEADALAKQMMGPYTQSFLPLGDLLITFRHGDAFSRYRRTLDLATGIAQVEYAIGGSVLRREAFASHPDQVIVVRLEAVSDCELDFTARLGSRLVHRTRPEGETFLLEGRAPVHVDPDYYHRSNPVIYRREDGREGMAFAARTGAAVEGGEVWVDHDGIHVRGARAVTLAVAAATGYRSAAPAEEAARTLEAALKKGYVELRSAHVADHSQLFNRVELRLGDGAAPEEGRPLPTDERVRRSGAADPGLVELLFQYGRYLMIASSRPGTQAANLQGIWNERTRPPWSSNYTLNINTQMNYWPAEVCHLPECHQPLFDLIEELAENGRRTAEIHYGCRGWTAHHNTDLWRQTAPAGDFGHGDPVWTIWPMAGAWLSQHLWEHFLFGGDLDFLRRRAYPLMKEAALFCLDWLVPDDRGYLVTAPSTSPEHKFRLDDGRLAAVTKAATMDLALISELFAIVIEASRLLGVDEELRGELESARRRLHPLTVDEEGRLKEWACDLPEEDRHHRHLSHLVGLYPGSLFHVYTDREEADRLLDAARRSLDARGDEGTGWSLAWKICLWARLGDGERAYSLVEKVFRLVDPARPSHGGIYPNLLGAHPPFQIDGNFGFTAGVAEMLLQSHRGEVHLLPALPRAWKNGRVRGLRARGGFVVDFEWRDGAVRRVRVRATKGGLCRIRAEGAEELELQGGVSPTEVQRGRLTFETVPGAVYTLVRREQAPGT